MPDLLNPALLGILGFALFSNIPLGYLRTGVPRFSVRWFVYIHLSIPFIVGLRIANDISWRAIPFTLALAVAGQLIGSRAKRWWGAVNRARRPRMAHAASAGDLLGELLRGWGLDERLRQYRALLVWDEVVGPQIAARAKAEKIRDGVLEVSVDQPVWMQQLQLLKPQILTKLNAQLGDSALRDIYLKRGRGISRPTPAAAAFRPDWRQQTLSAAEEADLGAMLAGVRDEELRQGLKSLLTKQMKLAKARKQPPPATDKSG